MEEPPDVPAGDPIDAAGEESDGEDDHNGYDSLDHSDAGNREQEGTVENSNLNIAEVICNICLISPELRSEESIDKIVGFCRQVPFFSALDRQQQRGLCQGMLLETFEAEEIVVHQGDEGDKFYVILVGSVSVQVAGEADDGTRPKSTGKMTPSSRTQSEARPDQPAVLKPGMGFGELVLQSSAPRRATIQAVEKTQLLVVGRAEYEKYAGRRRRKFIEGRVGFLRQCGPLAEALAKGEVSEQDIMQMASCLTEVGGPQGEAQAVICKQGDTADRLIFVRSGQLAILRTVNRYCNRGDRRASAAQSVSQSTTNASDESDQDLDVFGPRVSEAPLTTADRVLKAMMAVKKQERRHLLSKMKTRRPSNAQKDAADVSSRFVDGDSSASGAETSQEAASSLETARSTPPTLKEIALQAVKCVKMVQIADNMSEVAQSKEFTSEGPQSVAHFAKVAGLRRQVHAIDQKQEFIKRANAHELKKKKGVESRGVATMEDNPFAGSPSNTSRQNDSGQDSPRRAGDTPKATSKEVSDFDSRAGSHRRSRRPSSVTSTNSCRRRRRLSSSSVEGSKRKRVLRIGTLGVYQFYGDRQMCVGTTMPVSLVADPVAEVYEISKYDILRKLPKSILAVLFQRGPEVQPSDTQLRELERQTQRWYCFRRGLHAQALERCRDKPAQLARGRDVDVDQSRATRNLEFLGVTTNGNLGRSILQPPQLARAKVLTRKDHEHFSDASARFLRRLEAVRRDPGVREAFEQEGLSPRQLKMVGIDGDEELDEDPMAVIFHQQWSSLESEKIGLNLAEVLDVDSLLVRERTPSSRAVPPHADVQVPAQSAMEEPRPAGAAITVQVEAPPAAKSLEVPASFATPVTSSPVPSVDVVPTAVSHGCLRLPRLPSKVSTVASTRPTVERLPDLNGRLRAPLAAEPPAPTAQFTLNFRKPKARRLILQSLHRRPPMVGSGRSSSRNSGTSDKSSVRQGWCPLVPSL